jgi:hypothetical protein
MFLFRRLLRRWGTTILVTVFWSNRFEVRRWARYVVRLPRKIANQDASDQLLELRVRLALAADPTVRKSKRLRNLHVSRRIVSFEAGPRWSEAVEATQIASAVSGVREVRITDGSTPQALVAATAVFLTTKTGHGA